MKKEILYAGLILAILVAIFLILFSINRITPPASFEKQDISQSNSGQKPAPKSLYDLHNQYRSDKGLTNLSVNEKLEQSAKIKVNDMCETDHFEHSLSTGEDWIVPIEQVGYEYTQAGENLAKGYPTDDMAFIALTRSPTHLENIINQEYTEIGIAHLYCDNKNYTAIHYGAR
jgi:uncharacterized protein YkwD